MSASADVEVRVPDIGDFDDVDVIDVLVKPGDVVNLEDPLITLESEKATMDIPSPGNGEIGEIRVAVGDQVSEGAVILTMRVIPASAEAEAKPETATASPPPAAAPVETDRYAPVANAAPSTFEVRVPDIGDFEDVDVIDILVTSGTAVQPEDPLITLESDKATMDIPAPVAGTVDGIEVKVGDKVSEGDLIVSLSVTVAPEPATAKPAPAPSVPPSIPKPKPAAAEPDAPGTAISSTKAHASPSVRKFARELGVDVAGVKGTGNKGRIVKSDVQSHVKDVMHGTRGQASAGGFALPAARDIDFTKFGEIEVTPLSKIKKLTGRNLHRSWVTVPHVFQMDEADITELEAFRKSKADEAEQKGTKLTLLAFLVKAVVVALGKFPDFNASLSPDGESLIHKKYFHIGMAVNTDGGLVVPVLRDVDKKGLFELAHEVRELSQKARTRKITPAEMQGACFTISSLGNVGGTSFTPIINTPEVGILGISPSSMKQVYRDGEFVARLMLPFTLSYDHRVIDGVAAAQFTRYLTTVLGDIRHILL